MKDKKNEKFTLKSRIQSFSYAINGFKIVFREEHNARIHGILSIVVIILGFVFNISLTEWLILFVLIGLVIGMEIINSAVENLCDYVSPEWHEMIKKTKDLAAAAVLTTAIISVICGCIIFLPKIYDCVVTTFSK